MEYILYAGYGSNLLEERFLCYIKGGKFRLGGKSLDGCTDHTLPVDDDEFLIPHEMYFTGKSNYWNEGATALLYPKPTSDESKFTLARIWKVTSEQFQEIWNQEGRKKHDLPLKLGLYTDHCPIETFTSSVVMKPEKPSVNYIQTIVLGLRETFGFDAMRSADYLEQFLGISARIQPDELLAIAKSAANWL